MGLTVTLAWAYRVGMTIEASPDGSPDSLTEPGAIAAGQTQTALPLTPRMAHDYTEEGIFTDDDLARRFRLDYQRLSETLTAQPRPHQAAETTNPVDRWAAYLEECDRSIGRSLTSKLFGQAARIAPVAIQVPPSQRAAWRTWIARQADAPDAHKAPLPIRLYLARLMIQLLAYGVWDLDDESWREILAALTTHLAPEAGSSENVPAEARQQTEAVAAVCMGLLRTGASLTGGTPADRLAGRTWQRVQPLVAEGNPDLVTDLLIPPVHTDAVVLSSSELEEAILLGIDNDLDSVLTAELEDRGWYLKRDGVLYRVTGAFSNPVIAAAHVVTELGHQHEIALVLAQTASQWAFMAWRRPYLVFASFPASMWRLYRVDGLFTPASRFSGGEGIPSTGQIGPSVSLRRSPPEEALQLLTAAGTDYPTVLEQLLTATPR
jgi:hypothetical protein